MSPDPRPPSLIVLSRRELAELEEKVSFWRRAVAILAIACVALLVVVLR